MRVATMFVLLVLGSVGLPAATVVTAVNQMTPFRLGPHSEPIVGVRVNGGGPFPFILDTGSTHTSISDELAHKLSLLAIAKTTVTTSLGEQMQPVDNLRSLEIGPVKMVDVLATEVSKERLDPQGHAVGILGQDVLSNLVYTLDFSAARVEWNSDTHPQSPHVFTFNLRESRGRFLAELPQRESILWLVPDSGAETLVLYDHPHGQLPPLTRVPGRAALSTMSDRQTVEAVHINRLQLGHANLMDVPAVLVKRNAADPSLGDGLLPLTMFERVTFDGPGRRLTVDR